MKIDPSVAKEHDEIVTITSPKGDEATYKINKLTKQVHIKTQPGDGNDQEWRHCNVSYDAIAKLVGRDSEGNPVTSGVESGQPVEAVNPFEPVKEAE